MLRPYCGPSLLLVSEFRGIDNDLRVLVFVGGIFLLNSLFEPGCKVFRLF